MLIVIAGAGEVGYSLAKDLSHNYELIVIENDERKADELNNLNVEVVRGNAASLDVLRRAKVSEADMFIAVTGVDEVNMVAGMAAKKFGAKKVVVRVGNPEYVGKPVVKDYFLGFELVVCPQLALASAMANLITIPGAVDFVSFSGGKVDMIEIVVPADSPIAAKRVSELALPENIILTEIYRNEELIVPRGDTEIEEGDRIAVVGTWESIGKVTSVFGNPVVRNVVIFGGGIVGGYVARILDKSNLNIKLIDSNPEVCENLCKVLKKTRVVIGDATDLDLLIEEEVGRSDVAIATTESDGTNLLISLLAKSLGAKKTIARVDKVNYAKLFEKVGIDAALSPRRIAYAEIVKNLRLMNVHTLVEVNSEAVVLEMSIRNKKLSKKQIKDIKLPRRAIIGAILRGDDCLIPRGETELRLGDKLLIFTTWDEIEKVESRLS